MPNKIVASTAMWFLLTGSGAVAATTSCNTVAACVLGTNMSTGYGVEGTSKGNDGVFGMTTQNATSASSGRAGVAGIDSSTNKDGFNSGVYGTSLYGYGVQGKSTSGFGVVGVTMQNPAATADEKAGVAGYDRSTSGFNSGVYGTSPGGYGVQGSSSAVGVYGVSDVYVGVQALSTNPYDGEGLLAVSDGSHAETILAVAQGGGDLFEGGDYERVTALINVRGDMTLAGSLTANSTPNFSATDSTGSQVVTYGDRSTSATLNDMGEASLVDGSAEVRLDPEFARTINQRSKYLVFITPQGDSRGLYATKITTQGFAVRENGGGRSTLAFDYRIVARPLDDVKQLRLPSASLLPHRLGKLPKNVLMHREIK